MGQEIEALVSEYINQVENYAKSRSLQSRTIKQYNRNKEKGYKSISCIVDYGDFKVRFAYQINEGAIFKKGIITVYFNIKDYEYHICDLLAKIAPRDKDCVVFPYVDSIEVIKSCLNQLFEKVDKYKEQICHISKDDNKRKNLENAIKREIKTLSGKSILKDGAMSLIISGVYSQTALIRYTSKPYREYLNGNYKKALKLYGKEDKLTPYEKQLVRQIKHLIKKNIKLDIPEEQKTINTKMRLKKENIIYTVISLVMLIPIIFVVNKIMLELLITVISKNVTVLRLKSYFLLIPTLLMTAVLTVPIRNKVFYAKIKNSLLFYKIYQTRRDVKIKRVLLNAVCIISIIIIGIIASSSIILREDGIRYSRYVLDYKGTIVPYSDISFVDKENRIIYINFEEKVYLNLYEHSNKVYTTIEERIISLQKDSHL